MIEKHSHSLSSMVRLGALRWLHQLDLDPSSPTFGVADREYWAWKTKDFANGTWQGGLAGFLDSRLWEENPELCPREVVSAVVRGTDFIQRRNGSFEEAYPLEGSFAVTGLVVFNLAYSALRYPQFFESSTLETLKRVLGRATHFLSRTPETHGLISNHLVTSYLGMRLAAKVTGSTDSLRKIPRLEGLIHAEGWFPEYGGADPGYQTLLNHYLVAAAAVGELPSELESALVRSVEFLQHFALPTGEFSGEVGARGTGVFYPSGAVSLASGQGTWTPLGQWFETAYCAQMGAVTPVTVDGGNFVPLWNSWALVGSMENLAEGGGGLPQGVFHFPEAGLHVARSQKAVVLVSSALGTVRRAVRTAEGWKDVSLVGLDLGQGRVSRGKPGNCVWDDDEIRFDWFEVASRRPLNSPLRAMVLRGVGLGIAPFGGLQRLWKRFLAWFVMSGNEPTGKPVGTVVVDLSRPEFDVQVLETERPTRRVGFPGHMASANTFSLRFFSPRERARD